MTSLSSARRATKESFPNGIAALVSGEGEGGEAMLFEFQVGMLVQAVQNMLLTYQKDSEPEKTSTATSKADASAAEKQRQQALDASVARIILFIQAYKASFLFDLVASSQNAPLQDDLNRFTALVQAAHDKEQLSLEDCETLSGHRTAVVKNRQGSFHKAFTLFPVGIHIVDLVGRKISQIKKDALLDLDVTAAVQIAGELKPLTVDTLMKDKGLGELELAVPNFSKFIEMTGNGWQPAKVDRHTCSPTERRT